MHGTRAFSHFAPVEMWPPRPGFDTTPSGFAMQGRSPGATKAGHQYCWRSTWAHLPSHLLGRLQRSDCGSLFAACEAVHFSTTKFLFRNTTLYSFFWHSVAKCVVSFDVQEARWMNPSANGITQPKFGGKWLNEVAGIKEIITRRGNKGVQHSLISPAGQALDGEHS